MREPHRSPNHALIARVRAAYAAGITSTTELGEMFGVKAHRVWNWLHPYKPKSDAAPRKRVRVARRPKRVDVITKDDAASLLAGPEPAYWRPKTRRDCESMVRPCPFVGCRHHLALEVHPGSGSIHFNFPIEELEQREHTCALDVAAHGGESLEYVSQQLNVVRERVRQIESAATRKMRLPMVREDVA